MRSGKWDLQYFMRSEVLGAELQLAYDLYRHQIYAFGELQVVTRSLRTANIL